MFTVTTASAAQAVPAGRLPYDWNADTRLLHTVQRLEVVQILLDGQTAVPTLEHSEHADDWPEAYAWMAQQVASRTGVDHGTGAVFWAWGKTLRRHLVSSVVASARYAAQHDYTEVLLTLEVPRETAVLSCFADWHAVLNALPCTTPEQEAEAHSAYEQDADWTHPLIAQQIARTGRTWWNFDAATAEERAACISTWENCLRSSDARPPGRNPYYGATTWQACLPEISPSDVVQAVILTP